MFQGRWFSFPRDDVLRLCVVGANVAALLWRQKILIVKAVTWKGSPVRNTSTDPGWRH